MNEPVYWEIPSNAPAATSRFLVTVFGWKIQASTGGCVMVEIEGGIGAGIFPVEGEPDAGIKVYIKVADIAATLERVVAAGGTVLKRKTRVGKGWGWSAEFAEPGGCRSIALWSKD
ncbi:MAG: hypothetical protein R6X13_12355 [bacterium]